MKIKLFKKSFVKEMEHWAREVNKQENKSGTGVYLTIHIGLDDDDPVEFAYIMVHSDVNTTLEGIYQFNAYETKDQLDIKLSNLIVKHDNDYEKRLKEVEKWKQ